MYNQQGESPAQHKEDMKAAGYIKKHKANEFYVKKCKGYYMVMDGYDKSMASLECTEQAANEMAAKLNEMRNKRI